MEIVVLVAAFALGFAASLVRLPPLIGFLAAGFALHALGFESTPTIETISDLGVQLLLFGIGLKLRPETLVRPQVWGTASVFAVVGTVGVAASLLVFGALGLPLADELDVQTALIVAFGLSFSSTVFAVKALERTNETGSLAGQLAVGVLILQDIFAVGFLVLAAGMSPSWWSLAVIPALLAVRPLLGWMLDRSGHGELLVLLGFALAIGVGAELFELVDLKADLGALVAGLLLSKHARAHELSDRVLAFKDLFLVGFFVSIGLAGTPPLAAWVIGLIAVAMVPLRSFMLLWLFTRFRLRSRTALHASLTLSTYSEFGLIVAAAALAEGLLDQRWVSTIGVAVAGSFVMASSANAVRYRLHDRWLGYLSGLERLPTLPDDAVIDTGPTRVLVFGMGRVGAGAYDEILTQNRGPVIGVERDLETVNAHRLAGRNVIRGDALDRDFWERVQLHPNIELVMAATSNHVANLECVHRIREFLPHAHIAVAATYPDQVAELRAAGVDVARNLYEEAGQALATDATEVVWGARSPVEGRSVEDPGPAPV